MHFTQPSTEVVPDCAIAGQTFDIQTLDSQDLSYDLNLKIAKISKISISFDVSKVDEIKAASFMKEVK